MTDDVSMTATILIYVYIAHTHARAHTYTHTHTHTRPSDLHGPQNTALVSHKIDSKGHNCQTYKLSVNVEKAKTLKVQLVSQYAWLT